MTLDEMEEAFQKQGGIVQGLRDRLQENPLDSKSWAQLDYETELYVALLNDIQEAGLREIE